MIMFTSFMNILVNCKACLVHSRIWEAALPDLEPEAATPKGGAVLEVIAACGGHTQLPKCPCVALKGSWPGAGSAGCQSRGIFLPTSGFGLT